LGGGSGPAIAMTSDPAKTDNGVGCDRAADVHDCRLAEDISPSGHPRKWDCVTGGNVTGPIEDNSESALVIVVEKEDDAAREVGVVERWRGNQESTGKRGIDHCSIMPTGSLWRTSWRRNHGHQLTPMPSAMMWPHDVMSRPLAIGQPR